MARDKTDYNRHLSTKKHLSISEKLDENININRNRNRSKNVNTNVNTNVNVKSDTDLDVNIATKYHCLFCQYGTENKYNYEKHLQSMKHKNKASKKEESRYLLDTLIKNKREQMKMQEWIYENDHIMGTENERECERENDSGPVTATATATTPDSLLSDRQSVMKILLENQELQKQIMEKNSLLENIMTEQKEDIKKIIDKISNYKTYTYNTNHITYNQNTNIHLFLTEKCKDAVNMSEFVQSLVYSFESLEYVGRHGYVNGITKLIADKLNNMGVYERPIHCIDLKREVLYIKDDNRWEKDTPDIGKMKRIIDSIGDRNMKQISKWQKEHPEIDRIDTPACDFYFRMIRESSNVGKRGERNDRKIVSNICEMVHLPRDVLKKDATEECNSFDF
jgi:hypothetical protein